MPRPRAIAARWRSSTVPKPRPWYWSTTVASSQLQYDVATTANDLLSAMVAWLVQWTFTKNAVFPIGEGGSRGKETAVKRAPAGMVDGGEDGSPVVWRERADFDARSVA
jgi:hypothetical protein